jgi:hypothetical protein
MRKAGMLWPVLLLAVVQSAWAQQYGFTAFGPRDGLAQSQVRCMAQDSAGYLWFGTLGGASRFDGESFTNYGLRQGLRDPQVNAMLALPDGSVWLACGTTLTRFDGEAMWPVPLPGNTGEARILALAAGRDGTVYVGLDGAGLLQVRNGHAEVPVGWPADTAQGVRSLLMLPDGTLMVGLRNGLLRWTDGVLSRCLCHTRPRSALWPWTSRACSGWAPSAPAW